MKQLLYLPKRAYSDINMPVLLIFTRFRDSDTDDYKNLARLINCIQGNIGLPLILSIYKYGNIKW